MISCPDKVQVRLWLGLRDTGRGNEHPEVQVGQFDVGIPGGAARHIRFRSLARSNLLHGRRIAINGWHAGLWEPCQINVMVCPSLPIPDNNKTLFLTRQKTAGRPCPANPKSQKCLA